METKPDYSEYWKRNARVREMGYDNYQDYLSSNLYRTIKATKLQYADYKCEVCQKPTRTLHHRNYSYATLEGEDLSALVPVCEECHQDIEFNGDRKNTLLEANRVLDGMLYAYRQRRMRYGTGYWN